MHKTLLCKVKQWIVWKYSELTVENGIKMSFLWLSLVGYFGNAQKSVCE